MRKQRRYRTDNHFATIYDSTIKVKKPVSQGISSGVVDKGLVGLVVGRLGQPVEHLLTLLIHNQYGCITIHEVLRRSIQINDHVQTYSSDRVK